MNAGTEAIPELLPARMLNEFVYCPRLFYFEWVDTRWADNDDTEAGRFTHRVVDEPGGHMPPPEAVELLKQVRSFRVENRDLGLIAVIDRIDAGDAGVIPVDFKKGRPTPEGEPWPTDRAQVMVQAVLLSAAGYDVDHAIVYYAETNQRIVVPVTDADYDEVHDLVSAAREVANQVKPPLPLVSSPKCPRCSLVGLCLPDETNALLERAETPPRRITPRDPDHRPLYVTEQGAFVGVKGGRLVVTKAKEKLADVRLIDVAQLCLFGHVQVSSEALSRLWTHGVPVLWFSYGGWLRGWAQGEPSRYVELRRRQVIVHGQGGLGIACRMIAGKIRNCRTLLRRNSRGDVSSVVEALGRLYSQAERATSIPELLGIEGTAARIYFGELTTMVAPARSHLASGFDRDGRTRRPPTDPVNCLLSYAYALLLKDIVAVCLGVGLDPFIGVLHRPRFGRPSLALDLAEEFRPLIADSVVIGLLNNGEVDSHDFIIRGRGVTLTQNGRRTVLRAYERRLDQTVTHPTFGYKISYRRVIDVQARIMAAVMIGELPDYVPMTTR
ncbi:CRISPR-associated endonuclease Cas4g/Cas1g [Phytoactinopolyspora limicola]|uniref:CRISPR-associated endonuclease Cas4g/Cas1g n=1 Tax=Phytoactinopolyspora limicola TaxID=2715536 RepID=UPI00140A6BA2|nr:CRISPR-associated endonuclease Cas1 [Phytoactinopolyspora limicola]